MSREDAIKFLATHQPMPPDSEITEDLIALYDEVRKYFLRNPDPACIHLFLNSFGSGSGFGVYQLVEDTLLTQDHDKVVEELKTTLQSPLSSIRSWSAEIAASFPSEDLIPALSNLLKDNDFDIRYAAILALGQIQSPNIDSILRVYAGYEKDSELVELVNDVVDDRRGH